MSPALPAPAFRNEFPHWGGLTFIPETQLLLFCDQSGFRRGLDLLEDDVGQDKVNQQRRHQDNNKNESQNWVGLEFIH